MFFLLFVAFLLVCHASHEQIVHSKSVSQQANILSADNESFKELRMKLFTESFDRLLAKNESVTIITENEKLLYSSDAIKVHNSKSLMTSAWYARGSKIFGNAEYDELGYSTSISSDGNTVAMGAPVGNYVKIFSWTGSEWSQTGSTITGDAGTMFGFSISLSGDGTKFIVGAPKTNSDAGKIYVYEYLSSAWTLRTSLDGPTNSTFGYSCSVSGDGDTFAVGAPFSIEGDSNAGRISVYKWDGIDTWQGISYLGVLGQLWGYSIAVNDDGNTVVFGAIGVDAGRAKVITWTGTGWTTKGADINGEATGDRFGSSVDISNDGNVVVIGGDYNNGNTGHAEVYEYSNGTWTQRGFDFDGAAAEDRYGKRVSISGDGNTVAFGAPYRDNGGNSDVGSVEIWTWITDAFYSRGEYSGTAALDYYSVPSLNDDGTILAIGAYGVNSNGGTTTPFNVGQVQVIVYITSTENPTQVPSTEVPTLSPTQVPSTEVPTLSPTKVPSTEVPTTTPTKTVNPTQTPTTATPTAPPTTDGPSETPTETPSSAWPTSIPTSPPSYNVDRCSEVFDEIEEYDTILVYDMEITLPDDAVCAELKTSDIIAYRLALSKVLELNCEEINYRHCDDQNGRLRKNALQTSAKIAVHLKIFYRYFPSISENQDAAISDLLQNRIYDAAVGGSTEFQEILKKAAKELDLASVFAAEGTIEVSKPSAATIESTATPTATIEERTATPTTTEAEGKESGNNAAALIGGITAAAVVFLGILTTVAIMYGQIRTDCPKFMAAMDSGSMKGDSGSMKGDSFGSMRGMSENKVVPNNTEDGS